MIKVYNGSGRGVDVSQFVFPGGEVQTKLNVTPEYCDNVTIKADIRNSDDVMALLLVNETVDRLLKPLRKKLLMSYLPYARQDRACASGEAIGVKVFANLINSMGFCSVLVSDAHSDVGVACIDNCSSLPQKDLLPMSVMAKLRQGITLVSPDAGAMKKTLDIAKSYHCDDVVQASKVRDVATGEILYTELQVDGMYSIRPNVVIVDDICDGGRTFIELAKVLKGLGAEHIHLHVTHGIFSKGKEVFDGLIDEVTATYDWTLP
jgi:ribose-phosphate pyrophosphokinase